MRNKKGEMILTLNSREVNRLSIMMTLPDINRVDIKFVNKVDMEFLKNTSNKKYLCITRYILQVNKPDSDKKETIFIDLPFHFNMYRVSSDFFNINKCFSDFEDVIYFIMNTIDKRYTIGE